MACKMATPAKGKFHSQCGRFVSLSPDRERASMTKKSSFKIFRSVIDDMVYSDRPLREGQLFQVKLELISVALIVRGLVSLIFLCLIMYLYDKR